MSIIRRIKNRIFRSDHSWEANLQKLKKIGEELENFKGSDSGPTILYGPTFNIFPPTYTHDFLFSLALQLRGAKVIPFYCDGIQKDECNVYGGVWLRNDKFEDKCKGCQKAGLKQWSDKNLQPIPLSKYLSAADIYEIDERVKSVISGDWQKFELDGMPFGKWTRDLIQNNYNSPTIEWIENIDQKAALYLSNLLRLNQSYTKIVEEINPDIIVSHNSHYGMWATLERIAKNKQIPFYGSTLGYIKGSQAYAKDSPASHGNFQKMWKRYTETPLTSAQLKKVKLFLKPLSPARSWITFPWNTNTEDELNKLKLRLDQTKHTMILAANLSYDVRALNNSIAFPNMMTWVRETVEWYRKRPHLQLILKPHPAEANPHLPATAERVIEHLEKQKVEIPKNVILLEPDLNINVYDLTKLVDGFLVHTSNVGIEMAGRGFPVILTGGEVPYRNKGFTSDATSPESYFEMLDSITKGKRLIPKETQLDLAYKFILLYHYVYSVQLDWFDYIYPGPLTLRIKSLKELQPGRNLGLDYVINQIFEHKPIVDEAHWPPESNSPRVPFQLLRSLRLAIR